MGATTVRQLTLDNSKSEEVRGDYLDNTNQFKTMRVQVFDCDFLNRFYYSEGTSEIV